MVYVAGVNFCIIKELEALFPFGSRKTQSFVFTGIEMHQQSDHSIVMSQEKYMSKINPIHIQPQRKTQEDLPVTERERQDLRVFDWITPVCSSEHKTRPLKPLKFSQK